MNYIKTQYQKLTEMYSSPQFRVDVSKPDKNFSIFLTDLYNGYEDVDKNPGPPPEIAAREAKTFAGYLQKLNQIYDFSPWVLLAYLGIMTAITGVIVDFFIVYFYKMRLNFVKEETDPLLAFVVFWLTGFVMISISTSMGVHISPMVDGSGIPELKSILSGANTYKYLDYKIFFPKICGLITAYGAGLSVGKVGPLIHLAAIMANSLLKKDRFKHLDKNYAMKRSILSAAVGCGVTCAMGAPLGGLIFSIEMVIGNFNVSNVFKTVYATTWSLLAQKFLKFFISIDPLIRTEFSSYQLNVDIFSFLFLGGLIGLMTVALLKTSVKLIYLRRTFKLTPFERYPFIWITYTVIVFLTFPFNYSTQSSRLFLNDTFTVQELTDNTKMGPNPFWTLAHYIVVKWLSISLTYACNIPFGIIGPPITLGAVTGRLFAEIGQVIGIFNPAIKGAYAVVGAGACVSCVIRAIAPIVMLLEMTGQIEYVIPITIGVLTSYAIGNAFSMSFFDVSIYLRKLPLMPSLMQKEKYEQTAKDIMKVDFHFLTKDATHRDVFNVFIAMSEINKALSIPIVNQDNSLDGSVKNEDLLVYLEEIQTDEAEKLKQIMRERKESKLGSLDRHMRGLQNIEHFFQKTHAENERELNVEGDSRVVRASFYMDASLKGSSNENSRKNSLAEYEDPIDRFWNSRVDWYHDNLRYDPSPLMVTTRCYISKIQFLFTVTKATCIFVTDQGKLVGVITSSDFLRQKN